MSDEKSVAGQLDAGVAPEDTVTLADQRAGTQLPYALGPDGVPVQQAVPAEFTPPTPDGLTAEEVAEFRKLRAEAKARDEKAALEAQEAALNLQAPTHFVHLADGAVIEGSSIATHVDSGAGPVPVAGAYLKPEFVTFPG